MRPTITEDDLCALGKTHPEMALAYWKAVNAIIEYRKDSAAKQSGLWAAARLKKKQLAATFDLFQFLNGIVFEGQPLSEEEKLLVTEWVTNAASFQMLSKGRATKGTDEQRCRSPTEGQ
jgi:uncharacterized protein (DUF849 family)